MDAGHLSHVLHGMEQRAAVNCDGDTLGPRAARRAYEITRDGYPQLRTWRDNMLVRHRRLDAFLERHETLEAPSRCKAQNA